MNRTIKFRAWAWNHMIYQGEPGVEFIFDGDEGAFTYPDISGEYQEHHRLDKYNLMQSTGLKDKNGKEIYEGDILKTKVDNRFTNYPYDPNLTHRIQYVYWNEERACFALTANIQYPQFSSFVMLFDNHTIYHEPEVVGNIHENPDLLKKGKE